MRDIYCGDFINGELDEEQRVWAVEGLARLEQDTLDAWHRVKKECVKYVNAARMMRNVAYAMGCPKLDQVQAEDICAKLIDIPDRDCGLRSAGVSFTLNNALAEACGEWMEDSNG